MDYNNITTENFKEYENDLFKVIDNMESIFLEHQYKNYEKKITTRLVDNEGKDLFKIFNDSINIGFSKLFKFSHNNNIYFNLCSSIVYENTFEDRFKVYENEFIDVKKIEFVGSEYTDIVNSYYYQKFRVRWNLKELELLKNAEVKKIKFLETLLLENNCTVETTFAENSSHIPIQFYVEIIEQKSQTQIITKPKANKSLMLNGKGLNLKDRYTILNKVLDFDKIVHPLNIGELEKYQLLAYILGCDKDNARKLMNGSHDAKNNDLTSYLIELGLKK
jgi:hypothetical protein